MMTSISEAIDLAFIDPGNAGVAGQTPASIISAGTLVSDSTDPDSSIRILVDAFTGDYTNAFWIMHPYAAGVLHGTNNPLISLRGGESLGAPVVVSKMVPSGIVALVDASAIALGELEAAIRISTHGSVEMLETPTQNLSTPRAASLVSLWATNSVGIIVEKSLNWSVQRTGAVVYTDVQSAEHTVTT
jgi:hypothetical protein